MSSKKYIVVNFTHGNGPYLRTTELALAVNDLLEKKGQERMGIIVPWPYKLRQLTIMKHNFRKIMKKYPDEILLDENLGVLICSVFYNKGTYEDSLKDLTDSAKGIEEKIQEYFSNGLVTRNLYGKEILIKKEDLAMEINRCPLVSFGIKPAYFTSFAYMSEVLEKFLKETNFKIDSEIFKKGAQYYEDLEKKQDLHFIAEPATFYYLKNHPQKYEDEIRTPPNTGQMSYLKHPFYKYVRKGVYVTVTGVYGLARLFKDINKIGYRIYTHKPTLILGSKRALPTVLIRKNLLFHIARIGWGSAWLSMFAEKPLIVLPYDSTDDPEIYYNNLCLEKLGLCKIYTGQSLNELLKFSGEYKNNARLMKNKLTEKYGTCDGINYTAPKIIEHYEKNYSKL